MKFSVKDMCLISVFTAVLAVLAQLSIPTPLGVPLTLQTFGVALTGIILGARRAALTAIVYLMLGAVGAPVFTSFGAGLHRIVGPWGGYLLSFPVFAFIVGWGADRFKSFNVRKSLLLISCLFIGSAVNLTFGFLQLALVSSEMSFQAAFVAGFVAFAIPETVKMPLAFIAGLSLRGALIKARVL